MFSFLRTVLAVLTMSSVASCGGSSYSFARSYEPLDAQERWYLEHSSAQSYEEVRRARPEAQTRIGWFGIVVEPPQALPDGSLRAVLGLHAHQARHLCQGAADDSCRVTVSERELGRFVAVFRARDEDRIGPKRIWVGSLLKVYGTARSDEQGTEAPELRVDWYRHWPPNYYVTTQAASHMRR